MKCSNCGTTMEIYKSSTAHIHFTKINWRCPECSYEDEEGGNRIVQKPIIREKKEK